MAKLILLMGPTGSGKSVQGDRWADKHRGAHLSSGALLRRDPEIAAQIADGKLFDSAAVQRVVGDAIAAVPADADIMLDGLPRTKSDVEWLETMMPTWGRDFGPVLLLELDAETIMARLTGRDRSDDSPEAVAKKLQEFEDKTRFVVEYYADKGQLVRIPGGGTPDEVAALIEEALSA